MNFKKILGYALLAGFLALWLRNTWTDAYQRYGSKAWYLVPISIISIIAFIWFIEWLIKEKEYQYFVAYHAIKGTYSCHGMIEITTSNKLEYKDLNETLEIIKENLKKEDVGKGIIKWQVVITNIIPLPI